MKYNKVQLSGSVFNFRRINLFFFIIYQMYSLLSGIRFIFVAGHFRETVDAFLKFVRN